MRVASASGAPGMRSIGREVGVESTASMTRTDALGHARDSPVRSGKGAVVPGLRSGLAPAGESG